MTASATMDKVFLAVGIVFTTAVAILPFLIIPQFAEVFRNFEAPIPFATAIFLKYYPLGLCLPLVVVAVWAIWPRRTTRGMAACLIGAGLSGAYYLLMGLLMYYPIYQMGTT
jgi:hypothetical protein